MTKKKHKAAVAEAWIKFGQRTNIHGVSNIEASETRSERIFWSIAIVAGVTSIIIMVALLTSEFLKFPTEEYATLDPSNELRFPDISLCNLVVVPATSRHLPQVRKKRDGFAELIDSFEFTYNYMNVSSFKDQYGDALEADRLIERTIQQAKGWHTFLINNRGLMKKIEKDVLMFNKTPDFVIECMYRGLPCKDQLRFLQIEDSTFYKCWIILPLSPRSSIEPGREEGLKLSLFLYQEGIELTRNESTMEKPPLY